jgi:hypothetical protein
MPALNPSGIGVVSTIRYTDTDLEDNFRKGVKAEGQEAWCDATPPLDGQGFDYGAGSPLAKAIDALNNNNDVGLIVTVGGLATAIAAYLYSQKPFLSIVGGTTTEFPGNSEGNFYGGVDLQTFPNNPKRVDHLTTDLKYKPDQIALLLNPDAAMYKYEKNEWNDSSHEKRGTIYEARDLLGIKTAFYKFKNGNEKALIISPDSFFQDNKGALIEWAKASKKYLCYPFHTYDNDHGKHKPAKPYTKHGPFLGTEYYNLGAMAAKVVGDGERRNLEPAATKDKIKDEKTSQSQGRRK